MTQLGVMAISGCMTKPNSVSNIDELLASKAGPIKGGGILDGHDFS